MFQAVSTLREATLREWTLLPVSLVPELQNFLLSYAVNSVQQGHASDKYVQTQILQTLAVFYKRSKLDSMRTGPNGAALSISDQTGTTNMVKDVVELFKNAANVRLVVLG